MSMRIRIWSSWSPTIFLCDRRCLTIMDTCIQWSMMFSTLHISNIDILDQFLRPLCVPKYQLSAFTFRILKNSLTWPANPIFIQKLDTVYPLKCWTLDTSKILMLFFIENSDIYFETVHKNWAKALFGNAQRFFLDASGSWCSEHISVIFREIAGKQEKYTKLIPKLARVPKQNLYYHIVAKSKIIETVRSCFSWKRIRIFFDPNSQFWISIFDYLYPF